LVAGCEGNTVRPAAVIMARRGGLVSKRRGGSMLELRFAKFGSG
jgi:hypothetical protein